mmetsp:Transcript_46234/g.76445  ORF Transcript_46234/g.76445 Transcript_46234/m.76445 type:complete len:504 (-) Transcript_46234:163-1674(-)
MGKGRLGGNKRETVTKRRAAARPKRSMAIEKSRNREKQKEQILKAAGPNKTTYEAALAETAQKRFLGRAIVLAHGAGGSSTHSSMKAWKKQLRPLCDEVVTFDFGHGNNISQMAASFADAIGCAHATGHKRILLAGIAQGAHVALHLLAASTVPGNAGDKVSELPAVLRDSIVGTVALGYPLLRAGTNEARDEALRGLPAASPPTLLVSGSRDPRMDFSKLEAARSACAAKTQLHVVEGAAQLNDYAQRAPNGTEQQRVEAEALSETLTVFINEALGKASEWSKKVRMAKKEKRANEKRATSVKAKAVTLDQARQKNQMRQTLDRKETKTALAELHDLQKSEIHGRRAKAAELPECLKEADAPKSIQVYGCGSTEVNGTYVFDGLRGGAPSYRQVGGLMTIERDSAPGLDVEWCICREYGYDTWCHVKAKCAVPPTSGWCVSAQQCAPPPPTLFVEACGEESAEVVPHTVASVAVRSNAETTRKNKKGMLTSNSLGLEPQSCS